MDKNGVCNCCNTWEEQMYWTHFNCMHFFVTLPNNFHDHLVLPKKFYSHMQAQLPDKVSLKVPSGAIWEIELLKSVDLRFVGNEWKAFAKANELKEHCILVFKYQRNLHFEVLIFDESSSCEKEAAYFIKKGEETKSEPKDKRKRAVKEDSTSEIAESDEEDSSIDVSKKSRSDDGGDISLGVKLNTPSPRHVPRPTPRRRGRPRRVLQKRKSQSKSQSKSTVKSSNKSRNEPSEIAPIDLIVPGNGEIFLNNVQSQKSEDQSDKSLNKMDGSKKLSPTSRVLITPENASAKKCSNEYVSNRRPVTDQEKQEALQRAIQKRTENSFIVVMRPTSVYKRFYMNIPGNWLKSNTNFQLQSQKVVLRVGHNTWLATLATYDKKGGGFTSGWKKFALDNNLEEFDVLVFTPVTEEDEAHRSEEEACVAMNVDIFRVVPTITPLTPIM